MTTGAIDQHGPTEAPPFQARRCPYPTAPDTRTKAVAMDECRMFRHAYDRGVVITQVAVSPGPQECPHKRPQCRSGDVETGSYHDEVWVGAPDLGRVADSVRWRVSLVEAGGRKGIGRI